MCLSTLPNALPPADGLLLNYRRAMELEREFFGAQGFVPPARTVNLLVVDFDDTCTVSDTTGLIAQTAIAATVHQVGEGSSAAEKRGFSCPLSR